MIPILYENTKTAKNAEKDFPITYKWDSSNPQQTGNIITIMNNETNQIIYTARQDDFYRPSFTISANTLTNGILYKVYVQVIYNGGTSPESAPAVFPCCSSPTFQFSNVVENQRIENANYQLELSYEQQEGEELQYYQAFIYSASKSLIYESGIKYDTSNMTVPISGLSDKVQYYFRATGITVNGIEVDTGFVLVSVSYLKPSAYAIVELTNKYREGYTNIKSNIVTIEGVYGPDHETPSYSNSESIDLTGQDSYVKFDRGFDITGDFTIICTGYHFTNHSAVLLVSNGENSIQIFYREGSFLSEEDQPKAYMELKIPDTFTYSIYSNYIDVPKDDDLVGFCISRENNYYEITLKNLSSDGEEGET